MASYLDELIAKAKAKKAKNVDEAQDATIDIPEEKVPVKEVFGEQPKEHVVKKDSVSGLSVSEAKPEIKIKPKEFVGRTVAPEPKETEFDLTEAKGQEKASKSRFVTEIERSKKVEIARYGDAKIFRVEGQPLMHYQVPVLRPNTAERTIINTIKEAATRIISIAPYRIRDLEQRRTVYYHKIMEILKSSPELRIPEHRMAFYAEAVVREMVGYGIIDPLVKDDKLEEIMVIGAMKPVYIFHREYEMMTTNIEFYSDNEIRDLINKIARQVGRRVDISSPLLDARLADGSRVNATIPPASVSGASLTIRKFREDPYSIIDLINLNTINPEVAGFMWLCVDGMGVKPANILISGGTGSGKTTTLNVLASFIPARERIVSIEDTAELNLPLKHWIRMEARPPGLEATGEVTIDILTKNSLRMRPDRIIVGEVRHKEAFTLFTAMNTGHDGALTGDSLIQISDGNITEIGKLAEEYFGKSDVLKESDFEFAIVKDGIKVPSVNKETLKMEDKKITRVWRKKISQKIKKITLRSGKTVTLTPDHPIYKIQNGIQEVDCSDANIGDFIAMPKGIKVAEEKQLFEPYLAGLIYGDGHIRSGAIQFVNTDNKVLEKFEESITKVSKNKLGRKDYKDFSRMQVWDTKLVDKFQEKYEIPLGNKTKKFRIVEKILTSNNEDIAKLLKGLFDCEAHVNLHSNSIQFATSNPDLAHKLPLVLLRFGINASLSSQEKDGKGNIGPYYRVSIYGKDNIEKYAQNIGFYHSSKNEKIKQLLGKASESLDVIPNVSRLLKNARIESDFTQIELNKLTGCKTKSTIGAYETGKRNPLRKSLGRVINLLEKSEARGILTKIVESDLRFERIVKSEDVWHEGYVYDLTVEGNHNYISDGIIVSNCLGTIHANSSAETIARVTNPPMSVPEIMLSGLDFIIVEHRIHDKKKGTIRRLTEISEVTGVLEGKASILTIYERDATTDSLRRTNIPSKYLKELEQFSGFSRKQIEDEIKSRGKFLKRLADNDIRSITTVSNACQQYLMQRKGK